MMLAPIVEEIAKENKADIKVGKVNVDEQSSLAREYNIMSIPAVMVFKDGKITNTSVGFKPKSEIEKLLK